MNTAAFTAAAIVLAAGCPLFARDTSTPLKELLVEAETNNPRILAAEHAWRAAAHSAREVTTLPDPQFTVQQFSVGSPKPFAGFSNSDFAYVGFGASQTLPYPGKLHLKGRVADYEAATEFAKADALRVSIAEQVKTAYLHLAYLQQTLAFLERSGATLTQIADSELSHYRAGQGSQADVLKAQLEHTKLLREITMHHQEMAQTEAGLKLLLHRPQDSVDIVAENLTATTLHQSAAELLALVRDHNPAVHTDTVAIKKQDAQLESAKRGTKPDFNVGYMFEETGNSYRDYYMLTFSVSLPRRRRVNAEAAEAAELLNRTKEERDADLQQQLSEVQQEYVAAASSAELLTEYRDGLIPQAQEVFRAGLTAYQSNTQPISSVLSAFNDTLSLQRECDQAMLDHEIALVRLEALTGAELR